MRLSVTTVEAFRLWRDTGDWMALEDLEATIRKDQPPNENMLRGSAFHDVIERPAATAETGLEGTQYRSGEYVFGGEGMARVLALLPKGRVAECKATWTFGGITISGKADALHALDAYEAKCTAKLDVEKYFDSFQWRAYVVMFNVQRVHYILGQHYDNGGRHVVIEHVLPMTLYRYPNVEDDVKRTASECAEFIVLRGLESYVQDKEDLAA